MPGLVKFLPEFLHNLAADFKAVPADAGAYAGNYLLRTGAIILSHGIQSFLSHSVYSSSPSGVGQTNGPVNRIQQIKRNAVCIKGNQSNSRNIGNQTVYILVIPRTDNAFSFIRLCHPSHMSGMCLVRKHHIFRRRIENLCHAAVIFHHMLRIISSAEGKVHGRKNAFTDSAGTGSEAVAYQPAFLQSRK